MSGVLTSDPQQRVGRAPVAAALLPLVAVGAGLGVALVVDDPDARPALVAAAVGIHAALLLASAVCILKGRRRVGAMGLAAAALPMVVAMLVLGVALLTQASEEGSWLGFLVLFPLMFAAGIAIPAGLGLAAWNALKPALPGSWWSTSGAARRSLVVLPGLMLVMVSGLVLLAN